MTTKNDTVLSDGTLNFVVRRAGHDDKTIDADLLILKLTCEQCEDRHSLQSADGRMKPTPEFLQDLAASLGTCGIEDCTPTIAWQVWIAVSEQLSLLKKSTNETPSSPSGSESTPSA